MNFPADMPIHHYAKATVNTLRNAADLQEQAGLVRGPHILRKEANNMEFRAYKPRRDYFTGVDIYSVYRKQGLPGMEPTGGLLAILAGLFRRRG